MKNKRIYIVFLIAIIIILVAGYFGINYVKNKKQKEIEEYTPQEEINENQLRQTIVSLYFLDKESGKLAPEARLVDIKELINLPYDKLINLLIEGPKNEKLKKLIPDGTQVLKTYIENDCLTIDFSKEFLNYDKETENSKENMINSIVNTVTELTEVNEVKIRIDGQEVEDFNKVYSRIK